MLDGGWSDEDPRGASVGGRDADGVAVDGPASAVAIFKRRVPVRLPFARASLPDPARLQS